MDRIDKMIAAAYAQLRTAGVDEVSPAFTVLLKLCARAMVLNERGERWNVIGILHDLHEHCGGALEGALYRQCWFALREAGIPAGPAAFVQRVAAAAAESMKGEG